MCKASLNSRDINRFHLHFSHFLLTKWRSRHVLVCENVGENDFSWEMKKEQKTKSKNKKNQKATYRALSVTSCPWLRVYPLLTLHDRGLDFVFQTDHDTATELIINKDRPWCHLGWTNPEGNPPWILYFPLVQYIHIYYQRRFLTMTYELPQC